MPLPVLDPATAPTATHTLLEGAKLKFGFIPNLLGVLANSPAALKAYLSVSEAIEKSSLTAIEQQIVAIAVSAENGCEYCVAAHSAIASMARAPAQAVQATRSRTAIEVPRLDALREFTAAVVETRGRPGEVALSRFLSAGFNSEQLLDVIAIVAMKTLSNYTNHLAETPLDAQFAEHRWEANVTV